MENEEIITENNLDNPQNFFMNDYYGQNLKKNESFIKWKNEVGCKIEVKINVNQQR